MDPFDAEPKIVGEIPVDDVTLMEQNYQKQLLNLLARRGIRAEDVAGKHIRLVPTPSRDVYYVMAVPIGGGCEN